MSVPSANYHIISPASSVSQQDECRTPPLPTLSPASAPNPPPPAAPRRKSRPENAFILFRRKFHCEDCTLGLSLPSPSPSSISSLSAPSSVPSMASGPSSADSHWRQWKALAPAEHAKWEALVKEKKREHETLHPNYPRRKHSAPPPQPQVDADGSFTDSASFPNGVDGNNSFDANGFASSPTSLMPMISRRGGSGGGFDCMPSFAGAFDFEASLQSSDYLHAMFPPTSISPTSLSVSPTSTSPLGGVGRSGAGGGSLGGGVGGGAIMSPASSTSGSGPSSPYTPVIASFHPSAFSNSSSSSSHSTSTHNSHPTSISSQGAAANAPADSSYGAGSGDIGLGLGLGLSLHLDSGLGLPMGSLSSSMGGMRGGNAGGLAEGDFDIERIPEVGIGIGVGGWDMSCGANEFSGNEHGMDGEQSYEGGEGDEFGGQLGYPSEMELDLGMGMGMGIGIELGEMEMGFDEMTTTRASIGGASCLFPSLPSLPTPVSTPSPHSLARRPPPLALVPPLLPRRPPLPISRRLDTTTTTLYITVTHILSPTSHIRPQLISSTHTDVDFVYLFCLRYVVFLIHPLVYHRYPRLRGRARCYLYLSTATAFATPPHLGRRSSAHSTLCSSSPRLPVLAGSLFTCLPLGLHALILTYASRCPFGARSPIRVVLASHSRGARLPIRVVLAYPFARCSHFYTLHALP
ncbi:hypothetical protein C8R44DRAFT_869047 [Mycena epipterygia]|nr:hypothetical protein C8R44DRAFT_869047 [Mycena epipterygia]